MKTTMEEQIMNRTICSAVLFAAVTCVGLNAQTMKLQATVPFKFHVGSQVLPPGDYVIDHDNQSTLVYIKDSRGHLKARPLFTVGTGHAITPDKGVLVFNRYGREYFLSKVQGATASQARLLPRSSVEERIAKATPADLAVTASIKAK